MSYFGLDVGTMNIVMSTYMDNNTIKYSSIRNVFLPINKSEIGNLDLSNISHFEIDDNIYIISNDAFNLANIFNKELKRPMSQGLISPNEIDAVDVLGNIFKILSGDIDKNHSCCVYCCPAESIDANNNIVYHREVLKRILLNIGFSKVEAINEAVAIIYSNCANNGFSGISISYGAGMTNLAIVYKAIPIASFSFAKGGDWIDTNAALACGILPNKVTYVKENDFNLLDYKSNAKNKKEVRIREALLHYYNELINTTATSIISKINTLNEVSFPDALPIIVSGGTSKPNGFLELFKQHFTNIEFPFEISEVRYSTDQLNAVSEGCLIKSKLIG